MVFNVEAAILATVTSARFASLNGLPVGPVSPRPRMFRCAKRALLTSGFVLIHRSSSSFRLRLGSGVALRRHFAQRSSPSPLHFPARPPQTEAQSGSPPKAHEGLSVWVFPATLTRNR